MPIPSQLQGCSIIVCDKHSGKPIDTTPFNQITYQPGPFLTGYNAGNFYRLYVDLLYQDDTMPVPAIMAIMYSGAQRYAWTDVLPLVPSNFPNSAPMMYKSSFYDNNFPTISAQYRVPMTPHPDPTVPHHYGNLQFDYHNPPAWYSTGLLTIEIKVGFGPNAANINNWPVTQLYQWNIPQDKSSF